ncbi:MAG TPA: hypothetical protein VJ842_03650 [Pyrinomonadaceae bacterium]|nr:hypothetical protein [Pyrinomonadaceae bacterium]
MRLIKGLQRRHSLAIALAVAFLLVGGAAVWHASKIPAKASSEDKQEMQKRLRKGVGSEVRFASAAANPQQIDEAVRSADEFIFWRSGLKMSDETKKRLAKAESDVLKGKTKHITLDELTDNLTTAVVDRVATLTDEEIQQAADVSADEHGDIRSRADGRWGVLTRKELIEQAKSGREWSQRGDSALRAGLRTMIEEEVSDRAVKLSAALPEQFGQAGAQGVTPTQALLIAYSVAADDPLADSRGDIEQQVVQKRMEARQTREQKKAQKYVSGRPYGPRGWAHPSAPYIFFRAGIEKLLSRSEGGKK